MKGRLTTCEAHSGYTGDLPRIVEHSLQKIYFEEVSVTTIESFFGPKAITAMEVTNISQLDAYSLWTIIISESGIAWHVIRY